MIVGRLGPSHLQIERVGRRERTCRFNSVCFSKTGLVLALGLPDSGSGSSSGWFCRCLEATESDLCSWIQPRLGDGVITVRLPSSQVRGVLGRGCRLQVGRSECATGGCCHLREGCPYPVVYHWIPSLSPSFISATPPGRAPEETPRVDL